MVEMISVVVVGGIMAAISAARIHDLVIQSRVSRAATAVENDLEGAFAIAVRDRRPVRISWNSGLLQLDVTDRAGTTYYRKTNLGQDEYGFTSGNVSFSRSPLEIYPNGLAGDTLNITLTATLSKSTITKQVRMSRAGLIQIQ